MIARLARAPTLAAYGLTSLAGAGSAYLLLLLAGALRPGARRSGTATPDLKFAVVIPAHDEENQIRTAVDSLRASRYPPSLRRLVVVADNCTDRTAQAARDAGAEVWERVDPARRGKGHALAWAFERLLEDETVDAVCVVDADCEVSENLLGALALRLHAGADAVQSAYLISNPEESSRAALRWAGFALFNVIRPSGRDQLGLSAGLLGTGMAISRALLVKSPWEAFSFAEDREQHMRWVLNGARVAFAGEAEVRSPAPNSSSQSRPQEARWESGRARLIAHLTPRLLHRWAFHRDLAALDAALEPVLPPQSVLLATNLLAVGASRAARTRVTFVCAAAGLVAQVLYVTVGLAVLRAPAPVWRALLDAPQFVARRCAVVAGAAIGRGPVEWDRTPRGGDPRAGAGGASASRVRQPKAASTGT